MFKKRDKILCKCPWIVFEANKLMRWKKNILYFFLFFDIEAKIKTKAIYCRLAEKEIETEKMCVKVESVLFIGLTDKKNEFVLFGFWFFFLYLKKLSKENHRFGCDLTSMSKEIIIMQ